MCSCDPRLGQQCVAGRPLCLFRTKHSSCSSTGGCDFVVGSADCATSIGTTLPGPKLSTLSPLGCWLIFTASDDDWLGQVGNWIWTCTDAFADAHLLCGARSCRNHDHFSSLHSVPRHGGCIASCRVSWPPGHRCAPHGHHYT